MKTRVKKILTFEELEKIAQKLKKSGKTIVLCHGVFDLMHPGHIKYFSAAKEQGDVLMVTLTEDKFVDKGPGRPVFNQHLRAESVAALDCVDYVAINERPTAVETIKKIKPDIYAKGSEYSAPENDITGAIYSERDAIESIGGKIFFTDEITFSSTELLNKFFDVYPSEAKFFLKEFQKKYSASKIINKLKALKDLKVLIIGDTIIDEYHYCKAMGKSPKETIISTKFISQERFAGGVLACANHLAGFCDNVHLVTCLGKKDSHEDFIAERLKPNISTEFFYRNDACTIVKRRFVDPEFLTKSFEVSFIEDRPVPENLSAKISNHLKSVVANYDIVLVSDFGHGLMDERLIETLSKKAKFLAVNTQTNSANTGYNMITKYPRADYICIDEPEMRLAAHDKYGKIENIILKVADQLNCKKITVTRGHKGAITYDANNGFYEIPVFSNKIVDRTGAGDAFLSITTPMVAAENSMDMVGFVGNAVGAMAVSIVCNRSPIEPTGLYKFITSLLK